MTLVVPVLVSIASLLVTLIFGSVLRRELRSLRRFAEEGHDELDVRALSANRRVQARRTRYGSLRRAHTWRAFQRAAYEEESLRRINDLIAKVEAHGALVAVLLEQEQAAIDHRYREEAPQRVANAAKDLKQRLKTERGARAKQEPAPLARDMESMRERTTAVPATPGDIAAYSTLVTTSGTVDEEAGRDEETLVLSKSALAAALSESAAGGAHRSPEATPRAASSVAVAPPASVSPLPPSETEGVSADGAAPRFTPTVVSTQAMPGPAQRGQHNLTSAPLAHADLIGSEDAAEKAAPAHLDLDLDEPTPPRRERAALLVPVFRAPEGESA
jgi:hypothetical protein